MSITKDHQPKATLPQPPHAPVPGGTSDLPDNVPDFPPPESTDPGTSGSTTGK
jgi:hypothetical protein